MSLLIQPGRLHDTIVEVAQVVLHCLDFSQDSVNRLLRKKGREELNQVAQLLELDSQTMNPRSRTFGIQFLSGLSNLPVAPPDAFSGELLDVLLCISHSG